VIKIRKPNSLIRQVVNWLNARGYKLARPIKNVLLQYIQLPNTFNVKNTVEFIKDLKTIPINQDTRLASFDITNMYTNSPTTELILIIGTEVNAAKQEND
jgi:hypothetical protein